MLCAANDDGLGDDSVMSEIHVAIRPRPAGWADLPALDEAQSTALEAARTASMVVRGAPGSGRTTLALAVLADAVARGEEPLLLVPDRARADLLAPRVQALAPTAVRPVRTPASFAHLVVTTWRVARPDPLGPVELVTGALQDELLARLLDEVDAPWPDSMPPAMRRMPAFRSELRDLFARAGEAGLDGRALEEAGREFDVPQWRAAGRLLSAYLEGPEFGVEHRDVLRVDLSRIQALASDLVDHWEERAGALGVECGAPVPDVIVVDDLQDCTPSTIRLLASLRDAGARIVALADPDVAIATYRGGEPHLDLRLASALDAPVLELGDVHVGGPLLREVARRVSSAIGQSGPAGRRSAGVVDQEAPGRIEAHLGGSNAQLGAHIAHALRRHRLRDGIDWEDQAVIVRSAGAAEEFARHLRRGGVPVSSASRVFDFASQPTTRALLLLVSGAEFDADAARALLASPLVGCDPLAIHRLLEDLAVRLEGEDDPEEAGVLPAVGVDDLLERPELWTGRVDGATARALETAATLVKEGRDARSRRPREGLWRVWSAAGIADEWREGALSGGEDSSWFDDQLDAVVALMRVADVHEQREPTATTAEFARALLDKAVPLDTIATVGVRPPGVSVLTPAQAMGRRWTVVALVGLQDGAWPNTRLRTRSLRADLLADIGAGRFGESETGERILLDDPRIARRAVLDDERRLLAAALTRCSQVLHIGAVTAENEAPSTFFDVLAAHSNSLGSEGPVLAPAPAPLSVSGQVADLRRTAARPGDVEDQDVAALLLALLAREGVRAADPDTWTGEGPLSSDGPIASGPVRLSPSRIDQALHCPLQWFLGSVGAGGPTDYARTLGTLIHAVAEVAPHGSAEELEALLEARLEGMDIDRETWEGIRFLEKARQKVAAFADYAAGVPGDVEVETTVKARIGDVVVSGRLDRIEHVDGGVRIVDLKTGDPVTKPDAEKHPQLAVYQLALSALGYEVVGARLVFLGATVVPREQSRLDDEARAQWMTRLEEVGRIARGAALSAKPEERRCGTCEFRRACPAVDAGRRTVD